MIAIKCGILWQYRHGYQPSSEGNHMFISIQAKALRNAARAAVPVLVICALVLLSGCQALPEGQTPGVATARVEVTPRAPGSATATPRSAGAATASGAANTAAEPTVSAVKGPATPAAPTPAAGSATDSYWPCEPADIPEVFAMGATETGAELPPICITGFPPESEVDLSVTYPSGESEYFTETVDENGTAMVAWTADAAFPEGVYTLEAAQDDLTATFSVEAGAAAGSQEPTTEAAEATPEPLAGEPSIDVQPVGDSGWEFEVVLSGFEPNQEVPLTLYVATDEEGSDWEEIDAFYVQTDEQGETTYPLEVDPSDLPSSLFALEYVPEDGDPIYASFQVQ
jgi:hypothetical protein